jgi:hypothetical protein
MDGLRHARVICPRDARRNEQEERSYRAGGNLQIPSIELHLVSP